jgi:pimeloyl-ACP methyl ester carboxylesterase
MDTGRIDIGGLELAYAEAGRGGRPFILAHGFTGAKEDFTGWLDDLAELGWHAVAPDNRGHGESDKPLGEDAYALPLFAADALAFADAMGFDTFVLLGHSLGGMFSQLLALKDPSRVEALVLMDTHHGALKTIDPDLLELGVVTALNEGMATVADVLRDMGGENDPLATEAYLEYIRAHPERAEESDRNLRVCSPFMYASCLRQIPTQEDRLERLAQLTMPTLVIVGDQDKPFLKASQRMADTIPDARLAVIPEAGHSPQLESPDAWWSAVSGFLGELA